MAKNTPRRSRRSPRRRRSTNSRRAPRPTKRGGGFNFGTKTKVPLMDKMLEKYGKYLSDREKAFVRRYGGKMNEKELKQFIDGCKRMSGDHRQACLQRPCGGDYECLREAHELTYPGLL